MVWIYGFFRLAVGSSCWVALPVPFLSVCFFPLFFRFDFLLPALEGKATFFLACCSTSWGEKHKQCRADIWTECTPSLKENQKEYNLCKLGILGLRCCCNHTGKPKSPKRRQPSKGDMHDVKKTTKKREGGRQGSNLTRFAMTSLTLSPFASILSGAPWTDPCTSVEQVTPDQEGIGGIGYLVWKVTQRLKSRTHPSYPLNVLLW